MLCHGTTGFTSEEEIEPVSELAHYDQTLSYIDEGLASASKTVIIKLNGGLGTSMGMEKAKSLLPVKQSLSFLDIIVHQINVLNQRHSIRMPLVFMNSKNTRRDTLDALAQYQDMDAGMPMDFVQQRVPKVRQADLRPVEYPSNPDLEWAPPGHGDIYAALVYSGLLPQLIEQGVHYAFVSNSDNLGAAFDPRILGYIIHQRLPFLMEVARRTEMDKKGGHLARLKTGNLTLREVAQCPPEDRKYFEDIDRHRFFNTNTIWLDLRILSKMLKDRGHFLGLPLIRNAKVVNPMEPDSERVYQLENAMGAAISFFQDATAMEVPRHRFFPVKTCQDLLGIWSDAFDLTSEYTLKIAAGKTQFPMLSLDPRYY